MLVFQMPEALRVWDGKAFVYTLKSSCVLKFGTLSPAYTVARIYTCGPHQARCSHTQREALQGIFWNHDDRGLPASVLNAGSSHSPVWGTKELPSQDLNNSKKNIDPSFVNIVFVLNNLCFERDLQGVLGGGGGGERYRGEGEVFSSTLKMNESVSNWNKYYLLVPPASVNSLCNKFKCILLPTGMNIYCLILKHSA